jgi:hypothetical protein
MNYRIKSEKLLNYLGVEMASERAESDSRLSKSKYYFVKKKVKILFYEKKV